MNQPDSQRICALRLPGTSRAKFVDAADTQPALGDWVALDCGFGEEPGQVVVAPDQWLEPVSMDDVPAIVRLLPDSDLDFVAMNIERARTLISIAGDVVRNYSAGLFLCGLRLTLAGDCVIVAYIGDEPGEPDALIEQLRSELSMPVHLEQDSAGNPDEILLGGGTGLPDRERPETFRDLLNRRFDAFREPGSFAPHGMPRLGSTVQTPQGTGNLVAVDIRRWKATVALSDGEEISLSVDDLKQP